MAGSAMSPSLQGSHRHAPGPALAGVIQATVQMGHNPTPDKGATEPAGHHSCPAAPQSVPALARPLPLYLPAPSHLCCLEQAASSWETLQ